MTNPFRRESAGLPTSNGLARRGLVVVALATVLALTGAASMVGAATGSGPLATPTNIVSGVAEHLGISASGDAATPVAGTADATGTIVAAATADGSPAPVAGAVDNGSQTDDSQTSDTHANNKGCDDTLFANGTPPFATAGGPIGCTVGSSGDHRQNGVNSNDGSSQTTDTATSDATGTALEDKADPHANDHGCDDTLFANGSPPFATPGGPVGCTVGSSGDHRQNGVNGKGGGQTDGSDTSGTTSGSTDTATNPSKGGPGNSSGHGNSPGGPMATGGSSDAGSGNGNSGKGNSGNKH